MTKLVIFFSLLFLLAIANWTIGFDNLFNKTGKRKPVKQHSNLRIAIGPSQFVARIGISPHHSYTNQYSDLSDTPGEWRYAFDSVENGEVTIEIESEFGDLYTRRIHLASDTLITLTPAEQPNFISGDLANLPKTDLADGETMIIAYSGSSVRERLSITRKGDNYRLALTGSDSRPVALVKYTPIEKTLDSSFSSTLTGFLETPVTPRKPTRVFTRKGVVYHEYALSGHTSMLRIRRGDTVYDVPSADGTFDKYMSLLEKIKNSRKSWPI